MTISLVDAVKDTAETGAKQSVGGALDAAKGATEDVKLSNNQSKLNEERPVVVKKQTTTGEVGISGQGETPKPQILVSVDQEPVVEPNIPVAQNTISQE